MSNSFKLIENFGLESPNGFPPPIIKWSNKNSASIGLQLTGKSKPTFERDDFLAYDGLDCFKFFKDTKKCIKKDENGDCIQYEGEELLEEVILEPVPSGVDIERITLNDIDIKLFISHKGDYLENQYFEELGHINDNELYLFLEIDDATNYFGTIQRIIAGKKVAKALSFDDIEKVVSQHYDIEPKKLKKLFRKGISKENIFDLIWNTIVGTAGKAREKGLELAIEALDKPMNWLSNEIKFQENSWNPYSKEYDPPFLRYKTWQKGTFEVKDLRLITNPVASFATLPINLGGLGVEASKFLSKRILREFNQFDRTFKSYLDIPFFRKDKFITGKFLKLYRIVSRQVQKMLDKITKLSDELTKYFELHAGFMNAFFCGLFNGLVDLFEGILFLFQLYFKFKKEEPNLARHRSVLLEKLEGFIGVLSQMDIADVFFKMMELQVKMQLKLLVFVKEKLESQDANPFAIAYYLGFLAFFIIELVIETLLTEGTAGVARMLQKVIQAGKKGNAIFKDIIASGVKSVGDIFKIIDTMTKRLTKGADSFIAWLKSIYDQLFELLEDALSLFNKTTRATAKRLELQIQAMPEVLLASLKLIKIRTSDGIYMVLHEGRIIFDGTRKQVDKFMEKLAKMLDKDAAKLIETLADEMAKRLKLGIRVDGQSWVWTNQSKITLKWARESRDVILDRIEATLKDPTATAGSIFEAKVAKRFSELAEKFGDEITDFAIRVKNSATRKKNGDIDCATKKYIVEAKTSLSSTKKIKELYDQLEKYLPKNALTAEGYMNPFDKKVVVVYDDLGTFTLDNEVFKELTTKGVIFIKGLENIKKLY